MGASLAFILEYGSIALRGFALFKAITALFKKSPEQKEVEDVKAKQKVDAAHPDRDSDTVLNELCDDKS